MIRPKPTLLLAVVAGLGLTACSDSGSNGKAFFGPGSTGSVNSSTGGAATGPGSFSPGPDMGIARAYHTATLLQDGRVLVVGGVDINNNAQIAQRPELYDPAANSWTFVDSLSPTQPEGQLTENVTGQMLPTGRFDHDAVRLTSGQVLVAGGYGFERYQNNNPQSPILEPLRSSFLFDPTTHIFTQQSDMAERRQLCQLVLLPNQQVLVAGGIDDTVVGNTTGNSLTTAEIYDPGNGAWTPAASMSGPHTDGNLLAIGNTIAFVGGADIKRGQGPLLKVVGGAGPRLEVYDPTNDVWSQGTPNSFDRAEAAAAVLSNGQAFFAGGYDPAAAALAAPVPTDTTEVYDGGSWVAGPTLSDPRMSAKAAEIGTTSDVVVVGGTNNGSTVAPVTSCDVWGVLNNALHGTTQLGTPRAGHTATTLSSGDVLVTGGFVDVQRNCTQTTEIHTR